MAESAEKTGPEPDVVFHYIVTRSELHSCCNLTHVEHLFPHEFSQRDIINWFRDHPERFIVIQTDSGEVKMVVARVRGLRLCVRYQRKQCPRNLACPDLHLCRDHIGGFCRQGIRCTLNHSFQEDHTKSILEKHQLTQFSEQEIIFLLQHCHLQVCGEYQASNGHCGKESSCKRLHICRQYAIGKCSKGRDCELSHGFDGNHSRRLLQAYDLVGLDQMEVLAQLLLTKKKHKDVRPVYPLIKPNLRKPASESSEETPDLQMLYNVLKTFPRPTGPKPIPKVSAEADVHIHRNDKVVTICADNLNGSCSEGQKCQHHHWVDPWLWQLNIFDEWTEFDQMSSNKLEEARLSEATSTTVNLPDTFGGAELLVDLSDSKSLVARARLFDEYVVLQIRRLGTVEEDVTEREPITKAGSEPTSSDETSGPNVKPRLSPKAASKEEPAPAEEDREEERHTLGTESLGTSAASARLVELTDDDDGDDDAVAAAADNDDDYEWQVDLYEEWVSFDARDNVRIERARRTKASNVAVTLPSGGDKTYEIVINVPGMMGQATVFGEAQTLPIRRVTRSRSDPFAKFIKEKDVTRTDFGIRTKATVDTPEGAGAAVAEDGGHGWFWRYGTDEAEWKPFSEEDQRIIEREYQAGKEKVEIRDVYIIDFMLFHQINKKTKRHREIKRREQEA